MLINFFRLFTLVIMLTHSLISLAFAHEVEQVKLDKACEAARQVALKPMKNEIYQECLQKFKKSEANCQDESKTYNGNRINGAPRFYELPACKKAFAFRKKNAEE